MAAEEYEGFRNGSCIKCSYKATSTQDAWHHGLVCQNKENMSTGFFTRIKGVFKKHQ